MKNIGCCSLLVVYLAIVLDFAGFAMMMPVFPLLVSDYGLTAMDVSVMFALYSLAQIVGGIVLGGLSDRLGRKCVICASLACSTVAYAAFAFSTTLLPLLFWRAASGFCAGTLAIIQAYITDVTDEKNGERAQYLGYVAGATGCGFAFAPALGSYLCQYGGLPATANAASACSLLNFVLGVFFLGDPPRIEVEAGGREANRKRISVADMGCADACTGIVCLASLLYFLNFFTLAGFESILALYLKDRYSFTEVYIGQTLIIFGVFGTFSSVVLQKHFVMSLGKRGTIALGHIARCAALWIMVRAVFGAWSPYVFCGIWGLLGMFCGQPVVVLLGALVPSHLRGLMLGILASVGAAARTLAPVAAGALYSRSEAYPWWFSMCVSAVALLATSALPKEGIMFSLSDAPLARRQTSLLIQAGAGYTLSLGHVLFNDESDDKLGAWRKRWGVRLSKQYTVGEQSAALLASEPLLHDSDERVHATSIG